MLPCNPYLDRFCLCLSCAELSAPSMDPRLFQAGHLCRPGQQIHNATCIFCSVQVEGDVTGRVLVLFGNLNVTGRVDEARDGDRWQRRGRFAGADRRQYCRCWVATPSMRPTNRSRECLCSRRASLACRIAHVESAHTHGLASARCSRLLARWLLLLLSALIVLLGAAAHRRQARHLERKVL